MGPKKKSKANKLARMTEEERARYLQHRAAIEEEARRRKQQLIATFMKNKLKREEAFTRLNQAKINQQWRQILRRMKTAELKQDLQNLWNTFDLAIERKNKHIQGLLRELDESEEQYARIFQSHAEITDALIVMHEERLSKLHLAYENDRRNLVRQRAASDSRTKQEACDDEEYICMLLYGLEIQMAEFKSKRELHDTAAIDELRNSMLYNSEQMQTEKEFTMEKLWKKFIMVLMDYAKETEPKRLQYSRLKSRDAESSSTIMEHLERIDQLNEKINNHMQQRLLLKKEQEFKLDKLKMERDNFLRYFKIMRKRLDNGINLDQRQLMMLTVQSNDCIKHLNMLLSKGEQILRLCFMCRKMETEREKVIPFGCELLSEDATPLEYDEKQQIVEPFHQDMFDISKLENFWKRYSHVYLESVALKIHQDALKLENKQLQGAVRQYMATIAQGNGRKDIETPLVGARPNTTRPIRKHITLITGEEEKVKRVRPVTCIEASTSIAVKHFQYFKSKFKV